MSGRIPLLNRLPSGCVWAAFTLAVTSVQCSYDVVFSRSGNETRAGGGGQSNASHPSGGAAGSPTVASAAAGSPVTATFPVGISWQWQLTGALDATALADAFVVDLTETTDDELATLHSRGVRSVCNFSAGTSETWRSDAAALPPEVLGNHIAGRSDEFWLDVRSTIVRNVMVKRLDLAQLRGCSGVLPDSIDGYGADTGFPITQRESLEYVTFLSQAAHARGLSVGLSNAPELVAVAEPDFDFAVDVNCLQYDECGAFRPFLSANKPVLHAEIVSDVPNGAQRFDAICNDARRAGFSTILKLSQLDAWRMSCE